MKIWSILLLAWLFMAYGLSAQDHCGVLKGTVINKDTKEVIFNAVVTLLKDDQKTPVLQRLTDSDGNYEFRLLDSGIYNVKVQAAGYSVQFLGPVLVSSNRTLVIDTSIEQPTKMEAQVIIAIITLN